MSRSVADIAILDRDPPYHEDEKPQKPSIAQTKQSRENLQGLQQEISDSLAGPAYYGHHYGMTSVFGEPPKQERKVMTAQDWKDAERAAERDFMRRAQEQINAKKR